MFNLTVKKIAGNTLYQLIAKVLTMSVTVFITYMIARGYGRESYGNFSLMQSIPALFFIITDFGLNAISVRETSKDESRLFHYFFNVLLFRLLLSFLFIIGLGLLLQLFPYSVSLRFGIRLSLLLILTFGLHSTTNIVFQTKLRYDLSALSQVLGYFFVALISFILIQRQASVTWINFSYVIGGLVTFLLGLYFIYRLDISRDFYVDVLLIKSLFKEALPLGIMFVFSQMSFREDVLLLSLLRVPGWLDMNQAEAVGVYSLPHKVFEVFLVFPTFFMNAVYPVLIKHLELSAEKFLRSFKNVLRFLLLVGVLGGFVGIITAPYLVAVFGEAEFRYSIPILRILMGGLFLFYLSQPVSWVLVILKEQKYLPYIYLASALVNLVLNLAFIPRFSFYGTAAVTVFSEFLILCLLIFFARRAWFGYVGRFPTEETPND